ncbi:GNAT family N-acetyltransferase [Clostridia bacterium OttesenSCG-928-F22]|nr:GNAT family N-acetyltransferase [Clostridia bacterium OttesenSCG-928-F22]
MKNLTVRPATMEDIPAIQDITLEAFNKYARDLGMPEKVKALHETTKDVEYDLTHKHVFIGLLGDEKLGSIRFEILPGNIAYISRFGVKLIAQGCGMGRALMGAVEKACREMGVTAIVLHTSSRMSSLVRFYYGQGYYVHSTTTDKGYIRALLVRDLTPGEKDFSVADNK